MTLKERLQGIARFLPVFEAEGFEFGHWVPGYERPDGVLVLGYYELSEQAAAFQRAASACGWVVPFDWPAWAKEPEFARLRDDPAYLAGASADQLARLLTLCIRGERFTDGTLEGAYEAGVVTGILRRAQALLDELPEASQ
jgi:hypothetical protein